MFIDCSLDVVLTPQKDIYGAVDSGKLQFSWKTAFGLALDPSLAVKM